MSPPEPETKGVLRGSRLRVEIVFVEANYELFCFEPEAVV